MKTIQITIMIALLTMIFTSCDPYFQIEYIIDNQSSQEITIESSFLFQIEKDSSRIAPGTGLSIYVDDGIGKTSQDAIESLTDIHFDSFIITNSSGQIFKKDYESIDNWDKEYRKDTDIGTITLTVTDNDF